MTWNKVKGLKDRNGAPMHFEGRVVYRYEQAADEEHKAISIEVFGTIKHFVAKDADLDLDVFLENTGKSWVIHDEDLQYITVIREKSSPSS